MRYLAYKFLILILLSINLPHVHAAASLPFHHIIFFGDSLTDNGNLYNSPWNPKGIPKSPPYYKGRFTNGDVWADHVAAYFNKTRKIKSENYAYGGEALAYHGPDYLPWIFNESVTSYYWYTNKSTYSDTLYIIWLGGNDYIEGGVSDIEGYTDKMIYNLNYSIDRLIRNGGKNFLIINLPDLSKSPYSKIKRTTGNVAALIASHNAKLEIMVNTLRENYSGIQAEVYHVDALVNEFLSMDLTATNKKYNMHISEIERPCWEGGYSLIQNGLGKTDDYTIKSPSLHEAFLTAQKASSGIVSCENPDNYIFWDKIHPSRVMHEFFSQKIIEYIEQHYFN